MGVRGCYCAARCPLPCLRWRARVGLRGMVHKFRNYGDLFTKLQNAQAARHATVLVPFSAMRVSFLRCLERNGWIKGFRLMDERDPKRPWKFVPPMLRAELKYYGVGSEPVIKQIRGHTGLHMGYRDSENKSGTMKGSGVVLPVYGDISTDLVLSTSKGVMTLAECRQQKAGGWVMCSVSMVKRLRPPGK